MRIFTKNIYTEITNKSRNSLKKISFNPESDYYEIKIVPRKLLLLWFLPLLLIVFIPINEYIYVQVKESCVDSTISNASIRARFVNYKDQKIDETKTVGKNGKTKFLANRKPIWQFILKPQHPPRQVQLDAVVFDTLQLSKNDDLNKLIHEKTVFGVVSSTQTIKIKIVSKNNPDFVLPEAQVKVTYNLGSITYQVSSITDSSGYCSCKIATCFDSMRILAEKDGYFSDSLQKIVQTDIQNNPEKLMLALQPFQYQLDFIFCIDATGSMGNLINDVKKNTQSFNTDLKNEMQKLDKHVQSIRVRAIAFKDFYDVDSKPQIFITPFFSLPADSTLYKKQLETIRASAGGDTPESGLEALAVGFASEWLKSEQHYRKVFVLWTDAAAHKFERFKTYNAYNYPPDMPQNLEQFKMQWDSLQPNARIILYAPVEYPWNLLKSWPNTMLLEKKGGFNSEEYMETIKAIALSI